MIRIERAAAFWLRREASSMVQGGDQLQRAPCPFSSPMLGPPETSPSCISSSPVYARYSAWPCRWWGTIGGGQRATQEWLAWFGLFFFSWFRNIICIQLLSILEFCWVLFSSCGSMQLMLQLHTPWQPARLLKANTHESRCPGLHLRCWEHPGGPLGQPLHHPKGNDA